MEVCGPVEVSMRRLNCQPRVEQSLLPQFLYAKWGLVLNRPAE